MSQIILSLQAVFCDLKAPLKEIQVYSHLLRIHDFILWRSETVLEKVCLNSQHIYLDLGKQRFSF